MSVLRLLLPMLLVALLAAACWDHVPVEEAAFVLMTGIDAPPEEAPGPGESAADVILTHMIAIPAVLGGGLDQGNAGGNAEEKPFYLVSARASTIEFGQIKARRHIPRTVELNHTRGIVFGAGFARTGIEQALAWLLRQPQVRPFVPILVSREPAQILLDASPTLEPLPGDALEGLIREIDPLGIAFNVDLITFGRRGLSPREDAVVPLIERVDPLEVRADPAFEQRPPGGAEDGEGEEPGRELRIAGLAVFKDDRLAGFLLEEEARGAAWVMSESLGTTVAAHPAREGRHVAVTFVDAHPSLEPVVQDGRLTLKIELRVEGEVFEMGILEPIAAGRWLPEVEAAIASTIAQEIRAAMNRLQQEFRSDIFGFAEELYRRSPETWRRLSERWDEVYAAADLEVNVEAHMRTTGMAR